MKQEQHRRISKKIELCNVLKVFGKCDFLKCKKRHFIDKDLDYSGLLPVNGVIKFQILKMIDTTTCTARLLKHYDLNGNCIQTYDDLTELISDELSKKDCYHNVSKPVLNHLYLHKENEKYLRCKLVDNNDFLMVFLIDQGIFVKSSTNQLFKITEELKQIPQQSKFCITCILIFKILFASSSSP